MNPFKVDSTANPKPIVTDPLVMGPTLTRRDPANILPMQRIHSPVKYPKMALIKQDDIKTAFSRAAHEMTVANQEDSVESSDYFINPFLGDKRKRKFKDQTAIAKENERVKTLVEDKKALKTELIKSVSTNQKKHLIDLLIFYAKEGVKFEDLPLPFNLKAAPESLKEAYDSLKRFKQIDIPEKLVDLIDFEAMSYSEIFCELEYDKKIHLGIKQLRPKVCDFYQSQFQEKLQESVDLSNSLQSILNSKIVNDLEIATEPSIIQDSLNTLKLELFGYNENFSIDKSIISKLNSGIEKLTEQLFLTLNKITKDGWNLKAPINAVLKKYWEAKLPATGKTNNLTDKSIREYFATLGLEIKGFPTPLGSALPGLIVDGIKNRNVINQMVTAITNRLRQRIPSQEEIAKGYEEFGLFCEKLDHFDLLANNIQNEPTISLDGLLKEQRQHSLVRFNNLFNYYTAFLNTVHILGNIGKDKYGENFKTSTHEVVADLLEYAYIELKSDSKHQKKSADISKLEQLVTIDLELHRNERIMGYEKVKLREEDNHKIINTLNALLGLSEKSKLIVNLQRSHSLQFPSVFAWKKSKLIEFINRKLNATLDATIRSDKTFFSREFFKSMKDEIQPHSNIEELFSKEFVKILNTVDTQEKFLFLSLELVRKFYIRLFSETELFPDFINTYADGASEWRDKGEKGDNYKKSLSAILKKLVLNKKEHSKEETINALKPYLEKTALELDKLNKKLKTDSANSLFKKICYNQVEESMRSAMIGNVQPDFIENIFQASQGVGVNPMINSNAIRV